MNNTVELPFAIGEQVWWIGSGHGTERIVCPECAGTKVIEMIKGSGERVSLDCGLCAPGYDTARGWIERYTFHHKPTPFTPRRWDKSCGEFTFSEEPPERQCVYFSYAKDLFRDRDECQRRCEELNKERADDEDRRTLANIASKRKSLAFSATYWAQQVARSKKELAAAEARLSRCKQPRTTQGESDDAR